MRMLLQVLSGARAIHTMNILLPRRKTETKQAQQHRTTQDEPWSGEERTASASPRSADGKSEEQSH